MVRPCIVLCVGPYCRQRGQAAALEARLQERLGERVPPWLAKGPVRWDVANCLSMCGAGPNILITPAKTDFHDMNVPKLDQLLDQLLDEKS